MLNIIIITLLAATLTRPTEIFAGWDAHPCVHWRRQLWGTGARAPLDFQLVILGITRFTDSDGSCARFSVQ